MSVTIDGRYIGRMLRYARTQNRLGLIETANILNITPTDLRMFERGTKVISDAVIMRIMLYGVTKLKARHAPCNRINKKQ